MQYITTNADLAEQACKGGADWIQLRLKNVSYDTYYTVGREVQAVCKQYDATLIINDSPRLALELNADGVHVGKTDLLTQEDTDALLERQCIIGRTTNTLEDIMQLAGKPTSYIGLGPFRYTSTKENLSPVLGLEGYRQLLANCKKTGIDLPPVVGIGGIMLTDVPALMQTGLHGIAVSGAITNAGDIAAAARQFMQLAVPSNA
jgi:thiamine-phosphate pyrophosphorylase